MADVLQTVINYTPSREGLNLEVCSCPSGQCKPKSTPVLAPFWSTNTSLWDFYRTWALRLKQFWLMQVWKNISVPCRDFEVFSLDGSWQVPSVDPLTADLDLFAVWTRVTRYPRSACPTRSTACSGFTLEWITAGKWGPDVALLGSNGNLWIKWLNAAEAHSACDLYLIWFWRRVEGPQSSDSSISGWGLHLFQSAELCTEKQALFLLATRQYIFLKHHMIPCYGTELTLICILLLRPLHWLHAG